MKTALVSLALTLSFTTTAPAQLVGHWVADDYLGTGPWVDRVSGIPATPRGNAAWAPIPFSMPGAGLGLEFSGDDAFDVSAANNPVAGAPMFTVVAMFRTTTPGYNNNVGTNWWNTTGIVGGEVVGIPNDWGLKILADSRAQGGFRNNSFQSGSVADGVVHTTAMTWNGTTGVVRFYIDGEFQGTFTEGSGGIANNGFAIGTFEEGGTYAYFTGDIAVVQLYTSVENVQAIHQSLTCPAVASTSISTACPASQNGPAISFVGSPTLGSTFSIEATPVLGNLCAMMLGVEIAPLPLAPLGVVEPGAALCLIEIVSIPCASAPTSSVSLTVPWNTECGLSIDAQWFDYQGTGLEFSTSAVGKFTVGF